MLNTFYLQLYMGSPFGPSPVPREVIDALQSVSVTQAAGSRSGFQLTFATSRQSIIQTQLLPSGFFDPVTTRVQIVSIVAGQPNVLMDGLIARHEIAPGKDPGTSTLTVTGEDVSLAMSLIDLSPVCAIPLPAMPFEARVAICLAKYAMLGVIPVIIPSVLIDVPIPIDYIPSQLGPDLDYINYMAGQVGYVFYVTAGPNLGQNLAYWGPDIRWGVPQPALTVDMDAATNVESLSFSYDGTSASLYAFMVKIPETVYSIPIPIPSVGILRPPLAAKEPIPFKFSPVAVPDKTDRLGPIRAAALAVAKAAAAQDAVTGSGSLDVLRYGRILQSRALVDVRGAGQTYDGTYYVKSVTHNIKRGEYKQSFQLSREGVNPLTSTVQV